MPVATLPLLMGLRTRNSNRHQGERPRLALGPRGVRRRSAEPIRSTHGEHHAAAPIGGYLGFVAAIKRSVSSGKKPVQRPKRLAQSFRNALLPFGVPAIGAEMSLHCSNPRVLEQKRISARSASGRSSTCEFSSAEKANLVGAASAPRVSAPTLEPTPRIGFSDVGVIDLFLFRNPDAPYLPSAPQPMEL